MRRTAGVFIAAAIAAAGACSTFGSDSPDTQAPGDASPDGASPSNDASTSDASSDADANAEAATDGGAGSPCTNTAHWLCDDFDRDAALQFPSWGSVVLAGDGGASIDPLASAPSSPNVFTSRAASNDGARLSVVHLGAATTLRCALEMLVETTSNTEASLFYFDINAASYDYRLELRGKGGSYTVLQNGTLNGAAFLSVTNTAVGAGWQHVVFEIAFGATQQVHLTINGAPVITDPGLDAGSLPTPTAHTVGVGLASFAGTGEWVAHYDNVVCDIVP